MESIRSTICEACNNLFDLKLRKPVIILCGHTICETCFHQVCQPQQLNAICPIDKEQIDVIPGRTIQNKSYMKRLEDLTPTYKIICTCQRQLLCEYLCHQCQVYLCSQCSVLNHFGHQTVKQINYTGIDMTFGMLLEAADFVQNQLETNLGVLKEYKDQIFNMIAKCKTTETAEIKTLMMDSKTFLQKWLTRLNYPGEYKESEKLRVQNFQTINESNCCIKMSQANLTQEGINYLKQEIQNLTATLIYNSYIDGTKSAKLYDKIHNLKRILVIVKTDSKQTIAVQFIQKVSEEETTYDASIKSLSMAQSYGSSWSSYISPNLLMPKFTFTQENFFKLTIGQQQLLVADNCDETDQNISTIKFTFRNPHQNNNSTEHSLLSKQDFKVQLIEAYEIT